MSVCAKMADGPQTAI